MSKVRIDTYKPRLNQDLANFDEHVLKREIRPMLQFVLRTLVTFGVIISGFLSPGLSTAQAVKAFPTAEGFGANALGGRGGVVCKVTNLNDSGSGSLRNCVQGLTGKRIVIFDISGTIDLSSPLFIQGSSGSYITIAGQTSPGGIQLKCTTGPCLYVYNGAHDVIIRHLRIRQGATKGGNNLALGLYAPNSQVRDVIVDHCSIYWNADDTTTIYGDVQNVTFQWNIIAESVTAYAGTSVGKGTIIGSQRPTVTLHHNLYAHIAMRTPLNQRSTIVDFTNNIVYNWGSDAAPSFKGSHAMNWGIPFQLNPANTNSAFGNFVNNLYIAGPNSTYPGTMFILGNGAGSNGELGGTKIYTSGNWSPQCPTGCANDWNNGFVDFDTGYKAAVEGKYRVYTPFNTAPLIVHPTANLRSLVLAIVGAYKPSRDSLDAQVVNDVKNLTGNIANTGSGGPWPTLTSGPAPIDTDGDGIPDSWELARDLNPNDPSDGPKVNSNGYTNVENYLNELAGDVIPSSGSISAPTNLVVVP